MRGSRCRNCGKRRVSCQFNFADISRVRLGPLVAEFGDIVGVATRGDFDELGGVVPPMEIEIRGGSFGADGRPNQRRQS